MRANAVELAKRGKSAPKPQFKVVGKEAPPIKKLDLGGIAAAPSKSRKNDHPIMPVSAESLELLAQFLQVEPRLKEVEKQSRSLKAQIAPSIKADFFRHFAGGSPSDSTQIAVVNGERVRLVFGTRYTSTLSDIAPLLAAVGPVTGSGCFKEATTLTIDLDKMADDKQQAFVTGVIELAQQLAITEGITAKQYIKPQPGFHESRLRVLTVDQNIAVDQALPFTAYAKLEGSR
jgi:hypothetical protein